jgi:L-lactate dehydrogenase
MSKVAIVGAGSVGATLAYNLTLKGLVSEISLIDANREKAEAEVLDITHGLSLGQAVKLTATDYAGCADAAVAVVTAGARQKPGESRIELLGRNAGIVRDITRSITGSGFKGILLMISNPVDVLTWVAHRAACIEAGVPPARVIGSGTVLDSSRLREFLARRCRINPMNIHGYVLGEHGETSFPAWSLTTIGGVMFKDFCPSCGKACADEAIREEAAAYVRGAAETIIRVKGSTYYAIAQAASAIISAVLRDERRILPVSTVRMAWHGISRTAFSFPTIVGAGGAEQVLEFPLSAEDDASLLASAKYVGSVIEEAGL